ncbi:MAG: hypothetical protein GX591_15000 [Planctomycetes bacterium]|nr:hypothetical protein [Planctomycetota bacterium]
MLHYTRRANRVYVLTLDAALAADVDERIRFDPRMGGVEVILPAAGRGAIEVEDIAAVAQETIRGRLFIFDVRRLTLPRLQEPFNRIVGFNRADLNERCFSLCIGDGPVDLFRPGTSINVFSPVLAQNRIDYSPAAFFFDPLTHFTPDERPPVGIDQSTRLPDELPPRLAREFDDSAVSARRVREYFRAAGAPPAEREERKLRRLEKLEKLYRLRLRRAWPERAADLAAAIMSFEGYRTPDETLPLHTYPFFFEDWVFDCLRKAAKVAETA